MNLSKKILVTGATSGIGKALVSEFLKEEGTMVYGIGRNEVNILEFKYNDNFKFLKFDLSEVSKIEKLFREDFLGISFTGFVHCAGKEETLPITQYNFEKVQDIFNINVFAVIEILRFLSKKKYSQDSASFVIISSVMGELGQAGKVGYCSSKAALLGVVKSLALELVKRKIRVNAVSPGIVKTPMVESLFESLEEKAINNIIDMHPLGLGTTDNVIGCIKFLLSNEASWITGQNFKIDGGYSIR